MIRRVTSAAIAASAFTLVSAPMAGALVEPTVIDNGTGDARVVPLSPLIATVEPGASQWIAINWTSLGADARELKVTAVGSDGVTVGYPAFPVDGYSSGYQDDTLSESEIDYTALKISVSDDAVAPQFLSVTVSYVSDTGSQSETFVMPFDNVPTDDGDGFGNNGNGNNNGNGQGNGNGNSSGDNNGNGNSGNNNGDSDDSDSDDSDSDDSDSDDSDSDDSDSDDSDSDDSDSDDSDSDDGFGNNGNGNNNGNGQGNGNGNSSGK